MKSLPVIISIMVVSSSFSIAGELSPEEVVTLQRQTKLIQVAFDTGDVDTIARMSHPSIYKVTGGEEEFKKVLSNVMEQVKASGARYLESSIGEPSRTYLAGEEEVCFVPRESVVEMKGNKIESIGFLIAIRKIKGAEWLFLDGAGLRKNPAMLKKMLPALPDDVELPVNKTEIIE